MPGFPRYGYILNGGFVTKASQVWFPGTAQITRALFTVYPRTDGCICSCRSPVDDIYLHMQK